MKSWLSGAALILALAATAQPRVTPKKAPRKIQVALLLDASGSMDELIEQARSQLWNMALLLSRTECDGKRPGFEIALYAYGQEAPADNGYCTRLMGFSSNLDSLSDALFHLKAKGSDEYCGLVLHKAITELNWDTEPGSYRAIFIAGNESFEEGPYAPQTACAEAAAKGIVVNTIFCGPESDTKFYNWNLGSACGGGSYTRIDRSSPAPTQPTPFDSLLLVYNRRLQANYIPFSPDRPRHDAVAVTDVNDPNKISRYRATVDSLNIGAGNFDVVAARAELANTDTGGDLVAREQQQAGFARGIPRQRLPENLRGKTPEELEAYLRQQLEERNALLRDVQNLQQQRGEWLARQQRTRSTSGSVQLVSVVTLTLNGQLKRKGFRVKAPASKP